MLEKLINRIITKVENKKIIDEILAINHKLCKSEV